MIAAPPLPPSTNATLADRSRVVIESIEGALGTVFAVAHTSADAAPLPTTFTALTCTQYSTPLVNEVVPSADSFVTDIGEPLPLPSVRVRQVAPRSVEYS